MIARDGERNRKMPPLDDLSFAFCHAADGLDDGYLVTQREAGFPQFAVKNSKWLNDQRYQASLLKASIAMSSDCGRSPACARTLRNKASVVAASVWPD